MTRHATVEELSLHLDTQLPDAGRHRLDEHLADCSACRGRLDELRMVSRALREMRQPVPPVDLGQRVRRAIEGVDVGSGYLNRLERHLGRLVLQPSVLPIYALVLALGVVLYLFAHGVAQRSTEPLVTRPSPEKEEALRRAEPGAQLDSRESSVGSSQSSPDFWRGDAEGVVEEDVARQVVPPVAAAEEQPSGVTEVAGRMFYADAEGWIEVGIHDTASARLVPYEEARDLLQAEPELLAWIAEGNRVHLRLEGADPPVLEVLPPG